jgi:hypothetical protein
VHWCRGSGRSTRSRRAGDERHGDRRRGHQHEHAGRVRAGLRFSTSALKIDGDDEGDGGEDEHERALRERPVGRHAVARQVARHDVEQPRHRRRPANQRMRWCSGRRPCRRCRRGSRARGRRARGRWPCRPPRTRRGESAGRDVEVTSCSISITLMMSAAVSSSLRVLRMRPFGFSGVSPGSPFDERHHGDAGLEARQAERELREDEQRDAIDHEEGRRPCEW